MSIKGVRLGARNARVSGFCSIVNNGACDSINILQGGCVALDTPTMIDMRFDGHRKASGETILSKSDIDRVFFLLWTFACHVR